MPGVPEAGDDSVGKERPLRDLPDAGADLWGSMFEAVLPVSPFLIEGPASISFSGGRTSGMMLRLILDAYGGTLPDDVVVVFANTGKEREETLAFVDECARQWSVPIHWVERVARVDGFTHGGDHFVVARASAREVTFSTASRNGEPFAALTNERQYLPNPVTRFCTAELKIRTIQRFLRLMGFGSTTSVVGLRADEMHRVVKLRGRSGEKGEREVVCPLADAGISKADVMAFWSEQPFDLGLRPWEGNCDLCFLKGAAKRTRIMRDTPALADWWIAQEEKLRTSSASGGKFRKGAQTFRVLRDRAIVRDEMPGFFDDDIDDLGDCSCTD